MYSSATKSPDLFERLCRAHQEYQPAYDVLWRQERLLRYVYWLEHREHPPFNLVGSWATDDINAELVLWDSMRRKGADLNDAVEIIGAMLVEQYGNSMETAIQRGTDPGLAKCHLPVWDLGSGSLVPQSLGPWFIYGMQNFAASEPGGGCGYYYQHPSEPSKMSLFLFSGGQADVVPGVQDPRVMRALNESTRDIEAAAVQRGCRFEWIMDPTVVTLKSSQGLPIRELDRAGVATDPARVRRWEAVAVTGFRGGFLKVRLTSQNEDFWNTEACVEPADAANTAIADFIVHFSSKYTEHVQ
jgi:hypothetical protein